MINQKRGQNWSLEMIITSALFVTFFVTFLTTSLVLDNDDLDRVEVASKQLVEKLLTPGTEFSLVSSGNRLNITRLEELSFTDYDDLVKLFDIDDEFCIFLEDENGNIIAINQKTGIGSKEIYIDGVSCGEEIDLVGLYSATLDSQGKYVGATKKRNDPYRGLVFDFSQGDGAYVINDVENLQFSNTDSYSFGGWFFLPHSYFASPASLVSMPIGASDAYGLVVSLNSLIHFIVESDTPHTRVIDNFDPTKQQWYHITVVSNVDAGEREFYINGTLVQTDPATPAALSDGPLIIGAMKNLNTQTYQYYFDSYIDDVFVYRKALTQSEIQQIMNQNK